MAAKLEMTGDLSQLEAEFRKLQKAFVSQQEEIAKLTSHTDQWESKSRNAATAAAELGTKGKIAAAIYNAELSTLKQKLDAGTISKQEYTRQVGLAKIALDGETRILREQQTQQERLAAESQRAQRAMQDVSRSGGGLPQALASAKGEVLGMAAGLVGGLVSITGIVDHVKKLYEESKRIREEHGRTQMSVAEAEQSTIKMLGDVKPEEATKYLGSIQGMADRTGFADMKQLYMAAGDTLSATAGNQNLTNTILETVAPLMKDRPDQLSTFAGAVADLASITKTESPQEIKKMVSMVIGTTGQARITNFGAFKEAAAGIAGATAVDTGTDRTRAVKEAGAGFAAIGGAIKDPDGALTKGALAALAVHMERLLPEKDREISLGDEERAKLTAKREQLKTKIGGLQAGGLTDVQSAELEKIAAEQQDIEKELTSGHKAGKKRTRLTETDRAELKFKSEKLEERKAKLEKGKMSPEERDASLKVAEAELAQVDQELTEGARRKGTGLKTFDERLKAIQASRDLQLQFWAKLDGEKRASFRGPIAPVIKQLLEDKNSEAANRYTAAMQNIKTDPGTYDRLVTNLKEATPELKLLEQSKKGAQLKQGLAMKDVAGGQRADTEKIVSEALPETSVSEADRTADISVGWVETLAGKLAGWNQHQIARGKLMRQRQRINEQYLPEMSEAEREVTRETGRMPAGIAVKPVDAAKLEYLEGNLKIIEQRIQESQTPDGANGPPQRQTEATAARPESPKIAAPAAAPAPATNTVSAAGGASDVGPLADLLTRINATLTGIQQTQDRALQSGRDRPAVGGSALAAASFGVHREVA